MNFWLIFHLVIFAILLTDLCFINKNLQRIRQKEAMIWTMIWIIAAFIFALFIFYDMGRESAINFTVVYVIEKLLSIDNLFVFLLIFKKLKIQEKFQHKILFWGILGAIVFRGAAILSGIVILDSLWWTSYLFGLFLIYSGISLYCEDTKSKKETPVYSLLARFEQTMDKTQDGSFIIWRKGKPVFTVLMLALIYIEVADIIFALDSVPASLAITSNFKIIYTANVMAILGLRSLYFVIAALIKSVPELHKALSLTLIFIGVKMSISPHFEIDTLTSLSVILAIFGSLILYNRLVK